MTPATITLTLIATAILAAVVPYVIGKRALKRKLLVDRVRSKARWEGLPLDEAAREVAKADAADYKNPYRHGKKYRFDKDGHKIDTDTGEYISEPAAARLAERDEARSVGKHPALGSGYLNERGEKVDGRGIRTRSVVLTPRQLERVNTARSAAGRPMLNRAGFASAVAHAWVQPVRQPDNSNQWLTYLIMYECLLDDHTSGRTSPNIGLTITPDAPYNGHGGEYAGAGASGDWTSPDASTAAAAAAITVGAGITDDRPIEPSLTGNGYHYADPLSDPGSFKGSSDNDPAQAPSAPEPSYSAPDTSSSYTSSDSGSSSSSYDSGSSSGGGDSGGGGGDGS